MPTTPKRTAKRGEISVVTYNGIAVFASADHDACVKYVKRRAEKEFPEATKWAVEERGRTTLFAETPFLIHSGTQFEE
jgi:hypothetical protein